MPVALSDDESVLLAWNYTDLAGFDSATGALKWQVHVPFFANDIRPYINNSVLVIDSEGPEWMIQAYDSHSGTVYTGQVRINATVFDNYVFWQNPLLFDSNSNLVVCYSTAFENPPGEIKCTKSPLVDCLFGSNVCMLSFL